MKVILLGAPASGKGTLTDVIAKDYDAVKISTGNILRENIKNGTELGIKAKGYMDEGNLVPDELIIDLVKDRLSSESKDTNFILDGFPRTVKQADALAGILEDLEMKLDGVINLNAPEEVLLERTLGRRTCPKCGKAYHIKTLKPKVDGICDDCGEELVLRSDQTEEVFKSRLAVYEKETAPLIDYYKEKGMLCDIEFFPDINDVYKEMKKKLGI